LVTVGYKTLNLITFYTTVGPELRAWTVLEGTRAPQAAGKIHSDMEQGFVKAEVISYNDFMKAGSLSVAREEGHLRLEGKDYIISDGDIVQFKFSA
jgi:ribosome-binding ATPase YchF (GTP1/OBG family)